MEQPIVCTRQNLKPGNFDRRHLGETTLHDIALDLRSEDYESKTKFVSRKSLLLYEPSMFYRLQTEVSQQSGLIKMAVVNFLASEMKQARSGLFFRFVVKPQCFKGPHSPKIHCASRSANLNFV